MLAISEQMLCSRPKVAPDLSFIMNLFVPAARSTVSRFNTGSAVMVKRAVVFSG